MSLTDDILNVNWSEDEDDSEGLILDDSIIQAELSRREATNEAVKNEQQLMEQRVVEETERQREIDKLIKISITQGINTDDSIALFIDGRVILVSSKQELSDNLRAYIWGNEKPYTHQPLKYLNVLNELGLSTGTQFKAPNEVWGIIAVKYESINTMTNIQRHRRHHNNIPTQKTSANNKHGVYWISDCSLLLIRNNQIIDYGIWGVHSNFNDMIARNPPTEIFYNATVNDPTWRFLNYKYQPFYNIIQRYGSPMRIQRDRNILTMAMCDRLDIYCSLCNGIKDFLGLTKNLKQTIELQQRTVEYEERAKQRKVIFHRHQRRYNPYAQPQTHMRHSKVQKINNGRTIM